MSQWLIDNNNKVLEQYSETIDTLILGSVTGDTLQRKSNILYLREECPPALLWYLH